MFSAIGESSIRPFHLRLVLLVCYRFSLHARAQLCWDSGSTLSINAKVMFGPGMCQCLAQKSNPSLALGGVNLACFNSNLIFTRSFISHGPSLIRQGTEISAGHHAIGGGVGSCPYAVSDMRLLTLNPNSFPSFRCCTCLPLVTSCRSSVMAGYFLLCSALLNAEVMFDTLNVQVACSDFKLNHDRGSLIALNYDMRCLLRRR